MSQKHPFVRTIVIVGFLVVTLAASGYEKTADIGYRTEPIESDYARDRCKLDICVPERITGFPTLVWFHGGGLREGSRDSGGLVARRFTEEGIAVVLVDYRLSPKATHPAYIEDAAAAVAWTFEHIAEFGGDPDNVFVSGHSAGGYLTLMIGMDPRYLGKHGYGTDSIAGILPVSGQTVTHTTIRRERNIPRSTILVDEYAALYYAGVPGPPCICICGDDDLPLRAQENRFFVEVQENAGNEHVTYLEVAKRDHGTVFSRMEEPDDAVALAMLAFIRRHAEDQAVDAAAPPD